MCVLLTCFVFPMTDQGKYDEAVACFKRSLAIKEQVYGENHLSMATGLSNLGILLKGRVFMLNKALR